jgi:hypothetical protein
MRRAAKVVAKRPSEFLKQAAEKSAQAARKGGA